MLAKAQEAGQILDEDQLVFLANPGVPDGQTFQTIIPNNVAFQTEDLDTYDSDCDDISNAKAVLMANISNYGSDVISEVPHSETYLNEMENQIFKSESKEKKDKYMENEIDLEKKIKELDNILFKVGQSAQTLHMLTKPEAFYDNIYKQALCYQNPFHLKKAQRIKPTLYDGIVMSDKHVAMPVIDDGEILILEEESRSKILTGDFGKRFTPQQELSAEQAFWLRMSDPTNKLSDALPVKIEAPKELPKISLVNESLKKLKFHLAKFDNVNDLKAHLQDKDTTISKLKDTIKSLREKSKEKNVNYDYCEIETKNVELENKNEDLKAQFQDKVKSSTTFDSNTPVLSPTRLKCSTSNCGSTPTCNKKNDRTSRKTSRNMKTKVEAQPSKVNKKNRIVEPICDVDIKHSLLNANSEPICANCKKSMFDGVHDKCLLNFVENVNSCAKSAKKHKKQNIWKPMGHVFTKVGFKWKPTGRTFTVVGCPKIVLLDSRLWMFKTHDREPLSAHELSSKTKSWLWHRRLSHLNFGTINKLAIDGLARGIPRLKYQKYHLCSACALEKSKKSSHQPKAKDTNQEKLHLLHMDLCGLMRVASINGKRYILVIVDDYLRFTWVIFLRTKDKALEAIIKRIKHIQVCLNATVCNVQTDNGTEFVNHTLRVFYEIVGISHQTFVSYTPQQNVVVERPNQTLIEAARTMLIFSKAPLFLWAEAINTACYTQNRSIIRRRYNETPYELMQDKKPDLSFFHVFGALCYPTNDNDDLGKLDAKADIAMASEQFSSGPGLYSMTLATSSSGLVLNLVSQQPFQETAAPRVVVLADSPVSTSIDQDAPSSSTPSTQEQEQSPNISQSFEESPKTPIFCDNPLNESPHEESTPQGSSSNVRQNHTPFEHLGKWTKDHPL
ncbi:retrovirus-related pol polyprotein from transposon TNT 1-94 [Tanacetum coccineum]